MCRGHIYSAASVLFCIAGISFGETIYFLVSEANTPVHNDSYVLPLTEPNDIAHARDLIAYGPSAGRPIVVADIECTPDCINRDYLSVNKTTWLWHVTQFNGFASVSAEILDGWPGGVETNCNMWAGGIGFWAYTVTAELGTDPNHWLRDFDSDGDVDFEDYAVVGNDWDADCTAPDWCGGTDLNRSGKVDCNDIHIFAEAWLSPFASLPFNPAPACWSWPYQCYGDADNKTETMSKYRVYISDMTIFTAAATACQGHGGGGWPCRYGTTGYNACADFNRDYRLYDDDLAILQAHWQRTDTQLQPPCPAYEDICP
jgi:hypothetical protein